MQTTSELIQEFMHTQTLLWNRVIPKCSIDIRRTPDTDAFVFVEYLHPTKGWRKVSRKRIGI